MNYSFFSRIRILSFCILAFVVILIGKLFLLQVVHSDSYKEEADRQYVSSASDIFERNEIFFETKTGQMVSAAVQTVGFKLIINPSKMTEIDSV